MKQIPIVFNFNNRFICPAYCAFMSLLENAKETTKYELIIMHDGLRQDYIELLEELVMHYSGHIIRFMEVDPHMLNKVPPKVSYNWPLIGYYRLFLCDILTEYDKIIYSDVDVLFFGDLSDIYNEDLAGYDLANIPCEYNNPEMIHMGRYYSENKKEYLYWSGFFVSNLRHMRENHWIERLIYNIEKYGDQLIMFCTELLDLTAVDVKSIPMRYCVLQSIYYNRDILENSFDYSWMKYFYTPETIQNEINNMVILHYAGPPGKPWLMDKVPKEYAAYLNRVPKVIQKQNIREIRIFKIRSLLKKIYKAIKR